MRYIISGLALVLVLNPHVVAAKAGKDRETLSLSARLRIRVPRMDETHASPVQTLIHTALRYQLPFALEYVDRDAMELRPRLKLPAATVQQRIELLVGMLPGLKVSFSGGLVDVYALAARSDPSNLLNTVLRQFKAQRVDAGLADSMLHGALLAQLMPTTGFGGSFGGVGGSPVTIDAHNVRVYEALNMIVSEQGHSMWVVGVPPDKLSKLDGNLWRFYGLYPGLEQTVVERLLNLFPMR